MRDKVMNIMYMLVGPAVLVLVSFFMWKLEPLIYPPVTEFRLLDIQKFDDVIVISGTMDKDRDCELKTVTADGLFENSKIAHSLRLDFKETDEINLPGIGDHKHWGPWTITIQREIGLHNVILKSIHKCAMPWEVVTHLTTMPINYMLLGAYDQAVREGKIQPITNPFVPSGDMRIPSYGYTEDDPRHPHNKAKK